MKKNLEPMKKFIKDCYYCSYSFLEYLVYDILAK